VILPARIAYLESSDLAAGDVLLDARENDNQSPGVPRPAAAQWGHV